VPFGEFGSITNYSRDWVIDKITLTVNPDSDIRLIKKLVKQIGKYMLADPELSQNIIDPLKSQGVYAMREDGSIQIRLKITTKPGEQFVVRRTVYERVKQAFTENGIEFFRPMVQVAEPQQAAAHHAHKARRAAAPA
jgi:small-conductance mechanosensitive channel